MNAIAIFSDPTSEVAARAQRVAGFERPLPRELGTCLLVDDFLSPEECAEVIVGAERRGFAGAESDYPPTYRNNDRQLVSDAAFALSMLQRLRARVGVAIGGDVRGDWQLESINELLRVCRYRAGQRFGIHQDGVHYRVDGSRSLLTFMIYLNGSEAFAGGETLFYRRGQAMPAADEAPVVRLQPRAGSLIVFDHTLWHAGDTVTGGQKYILRSDLIYRRSETSVPERPAGAFTPGHKGYVWTLACLSDGRIASGGRDGGIRLWQTDGTLDRVLDGHRQSVLGLVEVEPGLLASVSRDRTLRYWDCASGLQTSSTIAHTAAVLTLARLDTKLLATGSADGSIGLWNHRADRLAQLRGHCGWVWSVTRMNAGLFASASEDGTVKIWNVDSQCCLATLCAGAPLRAIDVRSEPGSSQFRLAIADASGRVALWSFDGERAERIGGFRAHSAAVRRVRWLADGSLATVAEDNYLRVWRMPDRTCVFTARHENFVTDLLELSARELLSCAYDGALRRHRIDDRRGALSGSK